MCNTYQCLFPASYSYVQKPISMGYFLHHAPRLSHQPFMLIRGLGRRRGTRVLTCWRLKSAIPTGHPTANDAQPAQKKPRKHIIRKRQHSTFTAICFFTPRRTLFSQTLPECFMWWDDVMEIGAWDLDINESTDQNIPEHGKRHRIWINETISFTSTKFCWFCITVFRSCDTNL